MADILVRTRVVVIESGFSRYAYVLTRWVDNGDGTYSPLGGTGEGGGGLTTQQTANASGLTPEAVEAGSQIKLLEDILAAAEDETPTEVIAGGFEYVPVAASQSTQALGSGGGAAGNLLDTLVCVVSTAAASQVQIKDGSNIAITVLPNEVGAGVGTYHVLLGIKSVQGAWQITTAAGVAVIAKGNFT